MELKNKNWKEFKLTELFEFVKGDQNNMASIKSGLIPLVSAKKIDNGYKDFASKSKKLYKGNSLTLNNDGDGGAGISYYQPTDYLLDSHVTALFPKKKLGKLTLLFISRCITAQQEKFGHGYSINNQRLKVFKFMLPINSESKPDFDFMENYMKQKENELLGKYEKYISSKISTLPKEKSKDEIKWKEFEIGNIFEITNSKAYHKSQLKEIKKKGISYVSRTNLNNGIESIVEREDYKINENNTIVFGAENATFFYQPNEYITGNKMYCIKGNLINRYSGLFIQSALNNSIENCGFGYGKGLTGTRVNRRIVLLPSNESGNPNFHYMENYMKQLEYKKLKQYLDYKKQSVID
ncbi:restriction endonuclease subunit S [Flavobacterium psychrophilum]|uniref:restriction endonuclease subunit S n=1 Tax=Flavobacterium psychrophilum TaxID=96345 RepID=UPI001D064C70|nr:restriction endonuclease subunit S [Flavobacterium psychrophilum]EKT3967434.1 restriction endonuclease subunit S [Flavobacterium psychrophilum]MCB6099651.1 restriction endonuclease subunit S [Flavobacterium psychrophilum]